MIELRRPIDEVQALVEGAIEAGQAILTGADSSSSQAIAEFRTGYLGWEAKTAAVLETCFSVSGFMASGPKEEFLGTAVALLDLKIVSTTIPAARVPEAIADIREKLRVLRSVIDRLPLYSPMQVAESDTSGKAEGPIFLVHGRDLATRETVRRFIETISGRPVVVLAEQPNGGSDILGKLLAHAQAASFAVILLTPDDVGGLTNEESMPRARQNVVFELGLFIGLLGRNRVAALNESTVTLPTDFSGVAYIPLEGESWQFPLARELKAAGIEVSLDKAV